MSNNNLNVEIIINQTPFKQLKEDVDFTHSSYDNLLTVLRTTQKTVNDVLTEIVEQERAKSVEAETEINLDDMDDEEDSDESNSNIKRKITIERNGKKMKKS